MSFFSRIKKIFSWIPFLWKLDDGSYISLYEVMVRQMSDMQKEILKYSDIYLDGIDYCFQLEEVKNNLEMAIEEQDYEMASKAKDRALEIIKQYSTEWWI